jgi:pimeloyl-ACP methyl ester carboxylesterase
MLLPPGFYQSSFATSLGAITYYTAEESPASDQPPLLFLHGFGGGSSAYEWSLVYPAFVPGYNVFAPDLLGWGRSQHLTRSYQVQDYLTTIAEFVEKVCGPAIVIASSLTAAIAIQLAVARPNLFKGLILVAPAGLADFGQPYRNFFAQLVSVPGIDRLVYSTAIATSFGIRNFLETRQFAHASRVTQEMVDAYLVSAQQPSAEYTAISFVRGDLCFDLAPYMAQLTIPTGIIWGRQAQLTPVELGQRLVDLNPQIAATFTIIEDVGLTPQLELPAVTIGLLYRYLQQFSLG